MRIMRWLKAIDGRLSIHAVQELDPQASDDAPVWECRVRGFPNPTRDRPAVFLEDADHGIDIEAVGFGATADEARKRAICTLRGHTIVIIGQGRDEKHDIPQSLIP